MTVPKRNEYPPNMVVAEYKQAEILKQQGNPLIEALRISDRITDITSSFGHYPDMSPQLSDWGRMQMADLLDQEFFQPLPYHFEVIQQLFLSITSGYTSKNPASKEYRKLLVGYYRNVRKGEILPLYPWQPPNLLGFALLGSSGVGKSVVIENALKYIPQGIIHPKHKLAQVVWIKLDCPGDGSLKQFLQSVIKEFDRILSTDYYGGYKRLGTDGLIQGLGSCH
ncbi:hypothetical protein [Geomonas ferrireducens]|uniref:hypothetical protein n=1 Tax=Geomonas ferrireducens TaxID=2570227 RepID=UPI0010A827BC|nr:hypothetical protein [Geomonas ferrireducens]